MWNSTNHNRFLFTHPLSGQVQVRHFHRNRNLKLRFAKCVRKMKIENVHRETYIHIPWALGIWLRLLCRRYSYLGGIVVPRPCIQLEFAPPGMKRKEKNRKWNQLPLSLSLYRLFAQRSGEPLCVWTIFTKQLIPKIAVCLHSRLDNNSIDLNETTKVNALLWKR